jgi:CHAT domain-containing protein/tetratricopeptide (TPR) repeat protein
MQARARRPHSASHTTAFHPQLIVCHAGTIIRRMRMRMRALACLCALSVTSLSARAEPVADADALYAQAQALVERGDIAGAIPLLDQAAAVDQARGAERRPSLARDLRLLGSCLSRVGRAEDAIARLRRAEELLASLGAPAERAIVLGELGVVEYWHARYQQAEADLKQALALARARELTGAAAAFLNNLGLVYQAWGRYAEAIDYYRQAREEHVRVGDEWNATACLGNIANVHLLRSQFPQAEAAYKEVLAAFGRLGDRTSTTNTSINLGSVYRYWGRNAEARACLEEAVASARRERLPASEAWALAEIGAVYLAMGFYDKAESAYKGALETFRAADTPLQVASTTTALAAVYDAWGKYEQALQLYEQSLELAERLHAPAQILGASSSICHVQQVQERFEASVSCYRRALDLAERLGADGSRASLHDVLGTALFQWRKIDEAEKEYREALAISERLDKRDETARILIHLGGVSHLKGDHAAARELYLRGLELTRAAGTSADEATALTNLGLLAQTVGDQSEAERYLLAAIALKEQLRLTATGKDRRDFLASWISTYRSLVLLHALHDNPAAAFDAGERIKARYLAEQIGARATTAGGSRQGIEAVRRVLGKKTAILSFSNIDSCPVAILASREALRLHLVTPGAGIDCHVLCGTAGGLSAAACGMGPAQRRPSSGMLAADERLADMLLAYRTLLAKPAPSTSEHKERERLARELYARLIAPFEEQLAGKDELIVIPDGVLYTIPIETLRLPDERFLVERYHVTYLPSLSVRQLLEKRRYAARPRPLLAVAGAGRSGSGAQQPSMVSTRQVDALRGEALQRIETGASACEVYAALGFGAWPALPGARSEVEDLGRIAPGSTVLSDEAASEKQLKALSRSGALRRFGALHFATHGLLVAEAPELSALVLAEAGNCESPAEREDGYLSVREVAELDVQADFVTLSACETGLGKIYDGEGVVGLTQAFLEAGANGLSASLWRVSDAATKEFMTGLYRNVRRDRVSYARAMTEMKRRFIRGADTRAPFLWAPFVYYGR